ncbi:MAG: hypothetical protein HYT08_03095 [Candidatus Levybacteria bacterium]|nr:hypothetical protein [Candidatus Levybacteria bacterium]
MSEAEGSKSIPHPRKISFDKTEHFDREGFSGDHYVKPEDGLGYSALSVDVHGRHPLTRMVGATRSYYVREGTGMFTLNGVAHEVKVGSLFVIPDGGEYEYQGEMKLFEFNVPGTTSANAIKLEPKE